MLSARVADVCPCELLPTFPIHYPERIKLLYVVVLLVFVWAELFSCSPRPTHRPSYRKPFA